jgi:hypothetical protein
MKDLGIESVPEKGRVLNAVFPFRFTVVWKVGELG